VFLGGGYPVFEFSQKGFFARFRHDLEGFRHTLTATVSIARVYAVRISVRGQIERARGCPGRSSLPKATRGSTRCCPYQCLRVAVGGWERRAALEVITGKPSMPVLRPLAN
jgi:hypothetical protein